MKIIYLIALLLLLQVPAYAADAPANQDEVCYSQCAAYRLVWMDDYCWATFQHFCSMDKKDVGVQMVGAWASLAGAGADFGILINAYMCVELVDDCLKPILAECRASCREDSLSYAPNLYVRSAHYSEKDGYLHVRINNGGRAYMPSSTVEIYQAHLDHRNPSDSSFSLLTSTVVPDLRPPYVRYLAMDISNEQLLKINWKPQNGKYSIARIVIKPDPLYAEMSTRDNTYDYAVDSLPTPAYIVPGVPYFDRQEPSTSDFMIYVPIENRGETEIYLDVDFYIGRPQDGNHVATQSIHLAGEEEKLVEQLIRFSNPIPNYATVVISSGDDLKIEISRHAFPQFLRVKGRITDEAGNPIGDVRVSNSASQSPDFPRPSGFPFTARTDSRGNYELPLISDEGRITISAAKVGYYPNQTQIHFEYPAEADYSFSEEVAYVDLVLLQHPMEMSIGYPTQGRYIIETDRERFTGKFVPMVAIPVRGSNGTFAVFSPLCSPMISDFSTPFPQGQLPAQNITCLTPDNNDDYTVLSAQELVFEKEYPDEIPQRAFFDKRGDHVYVITINKGNSLCNLYSYSLPGGQQIYRNELNSLCLQTSTFIPAYDGSKLYAGIGVHSGVKVGTNKSMGYIFSENGQVLSSWEYDRHTTNLEPTTATEFLDLLSHPGYLYRGEKVENCMLSEGQPCREGGTGYHMKSVGIAGHRGVTGCNSSYCVVTLGHTDYVELPNYVVNSMVRGNYLNQDLFQGSYKGGHYLHDGQISWETDKEMEYVSMSPGGSYVLIGFDPYKVSVFDSATGNEHIIDGAHKTGARGLEATERGLFYATTKGGKMSIYRLSTLSEPQSGTSAGGGTESFFWFVSALFQTLVDAFNAAVEFFASFLP